ncbi:Hypothetical predicted protein, partial [Mytilus galloprovincialis]
EEAENLAKRLRLRFYRTSVKDNLNVEEVFRYLSEKYLEQINEVEEEEEYLPKTIGTSLMDSEPINNSKDNHVKEKNGTKNNKHKYRNHHDDGAIKLEPSKRRTKGKKSVVKDKCVIL